MMFAPLEIKPLTNIIWESYLIEMYFVEIVPIKTYKMFSIKINFWENMIPVKYVSVYYSFQQHNIFTNGSCFQSNNEWFNKNTVMN